MLERPNICYIFEKLRVQGWTKTTNTWNLTAVRCQHMYTDHLNHATRSDFRQTIQCPESGLLIQMSRIAHLPFL